ncbi:MAG: Rrf2 family transcriptional regulator [Chloroflexota bacterium]
MKLSTRARYGTRALLDIALQADEKPVLLKDVAQRQAISLLYLERIITPLITTGILRSTRGPKGGVWLARRPEEVNLSTVIRLLEGSTSPTECIDNPGVCSRSRDCVTRELWSEMKEATDKVLESMTLRDLIERQEKKSQPAEMMYYI